MFATIKQSDVRVASLVFWSGCSCLSGTCRPAPWDLLPNCWYNKQMDSQFWKYDRSLTIQLWNCSTLFEMMSSLLRNASPRWEVLQKQDQRSSLSDDFTWARLCVDRSIDHIKNSLEVTVSVSLIACFEQRPTWKSVIWGRKARAATAVASQQMVFDYLLSLKNSFQKWSFSSSKSICHHASVISHGKNTSTQRLWRTRRWRDVLT